MKMKRWIALPGLLSILLFARTAFCQETPPAPADGQVPPPAAPIQPATSPTAEPLPPPPATTDSQPSVIVRPPAQQPSRALRTPATPTPTDTAVVSGDNVNVRGQASIYSEVVARLKRGDRVVVLEDVTRTNAKPGSPPEWSKIALPEGSFVWVHSDYIDPATKAVKPTLLNVRSGPGENFSVLGQLDRGTLIRDIETQGKWLKIAAPPNSYAFVASYLVGRADPPATPPVEIATVPSPSPVAETRPEPNPVSETAVVPEATLSTTALSPSAESLQPEEVIAVPEPLADAPPPAAIDPAEQEIPPAEEAPIEPESASQLVKRIVSREGIVRRSVSIQAPTEFSLQNEENRKTINYLLPPPSRAIVLRGYEGQRIIVTGEELIDVRWPKTPVLNIDTLRSRP